jgi:hypothetical protein
MFAIPEQPSTNLSFGNIGPSANCDVYRDYMLVCHLVDTPLPNGVAQPEDDDWVMFDDDASMWAPTITQMMILSQT